MNGCGLCSRSFDVQNHGGVSVWLAMQIRHDFPLPRNRVAVKQMTNFQLRAGLFLFSLNHALPLLCSGERNPPSARLQLCYCIGNTSCGPSRFDEVWLSCGALVPESRIPSDQIQACYREDWFRIEEVYLNLNALVATDPLRTTDGGWGDWGDVGGVIERHKGTEKLSRKQRQAGSCQGLAHMP